MLDPDAPFHWTLSENGNFTCEWGFLNATVFYSDGGFKYVVNVDGGGRDDAIFGEPLSCESSAAMDAENKMAEILRGLLARRAGR